VLGLNKVIMGEMGPYGITANSVLWDADAATQADLARAVGGAVAWLASELAGYTSGCVLTIDGGRGERLF
jgi:NAD(P)-dependent dehydrogenase (short-subunit alcohol dehydrogenase family)